MAAKNRKSDLPKVKITRASFSYLSRLFKYMGSNRWKFLIGLIFLVLTSGTALAFPVLLGKLINASTAVSPDEIDRIGFILLYVFIAQAVFSFFRVYLFVTATENMLAALRQSVYTHLITLPMQFFGEKRVGDLNSRLSTDLSMLQETFTTTIAELIRQFLLVIGGIIFISLTSIKLTLIMLAVVPVLAILAVVFGRYIRKLSKQVQDRIADSNTIVEETLQGISNVKAFANELFEITRYRKSTDKIVETAVKSGKARGAFASFIILAIFGALVGVIWKGVDMVRAEELTIGEMFQFLLYSVFVGASIGGIAELYASVQRAFGAMERIFDVMEEPGEDVRLSETHQLKGNISGRVNFDSVSFHYPSRPELNVLNEISFSAAPGESIAIVGPSGAGKSTIVSLLLRFYDPAYGNLEVDGKSIKEWDLTTLRSNMAVVPQDVLLFGGTIRENIAYGKPGSSQEEITDAAVKANADEFIMSFPEGYDTIVGERGVKLSGGQRQRIAIARAVLRDPSILILDEATSSLDSNSEMLVQEALDKLMKGRTTFVIAHRLSTIRNADRILVLDKGKIVESGPHEELIANKDGLYHALCTVQFEA